MEEIFANQLHSFEAMYSKKELENGLIVYGSPTEKNSFVLNFLAYGPTFDIVSKALEEATYINHITGEPFVRTSIFYEEIFKNAIVSLNLDDKTIEIKNLDFNKINYNLIKIVSKAWIKNVL